MKIFLSCQLLKVDRLLGMQDGTLNRYCRVWAQKQEVQLGCQEKGSSWSTRACLHAGRNLNPNSVAGISALRQQSTLSTCVQYTTTKSEKTSKLLNHCHLSVALALPLCPNTHVQQHSASSHAAHHVRLASTTRLHLSVFQTCSFFVDMRWHTWHAWHLSVFTYDCCVLRKHYMVDPCWT